MKNSKAQNIVLWDKVDDNVQFTQFIVTRQLQMLQELTSQSQQKEHDQKQKNTLKSFKITKKMLNHNFKQQEQKAMRIQNKMAYLRLNQYRQQKALQSTKKKIIQLAGIRNRSLRQKEAMVEMRKTYDFEHSMQLEARTNLVKSSRKNRQQALQKWRNTIQTTADNIRVEKNRFHTMASLQKKQQLYLKLKQAEKVRQSLQKSRAIVEQSHQIKIQATKSRYQRQLEQRYKKLHQQKMHNEKLFKMFKNQAQKITNRQGKIKRQVQACKDIWNQSQQNPQNDIIFIKSRLIPLTPLTYHS